MGIILTSYNNIHKSRTENHINTSISNYNHIKLLTLSEKLINEFKIINFGKWDANFENK